MKNTVLSTFLVLGLFLMPGYGLNFMSGSSVDWGHDDAVENQVATAADTTNPATVKPHAAAETLPPAKTHVSSLNSPYSSDQPGN